MPILIRKAQKGEKLTLTNPTDKNHQSPSNDVMRKLINKYPALANVYGKKGENIVVRSDKNFHPEGYGSIEFMHPGFKDVNYNKKGENDPNMIFQNPNKKGGYGIIYNPKDNNAQDIYLDLLHGMHKDPKFAALKKAFGKRALEARSGDLRHFYEEDKAKGNAQDGKDQWYKNAIDGYLRSEFYEGKDDGDYTEERKGNSFEMKDLAERMKIYMLGSPKLLKHKTINEI